MRRIRIEVCSVNGQVVATSCCEGIAPLRGMWQVWRDGPVSIDDLQAKVALTLAGIPSHKKPKSVPETARTVKGKSRG